MRLKHTIVAGNHVRGTKLEEGGTTRCPMGVRLMLLSKIFRNVAVADNTLEVPDHVAVADDANFAVPYENAVVFIPWYLFVAGQNADAWQNIQVHNNRNLAGHVLRLKTQDSGSGRKGWNSYSTREQRFRSPLFDRAARVYYDEFLGVVPTSALGWIDASGNGGSIAAGASTIDHPGVIELSTGTQSNGYAMLRLPTSGIVLASSGPAHVFDFGIRCAEGYADYCFGLVQDGSEVGAYFLFNRWYAETQGKLRFICHPYGGSTNLTTFSEFDWGALWMRYRIEIASDASMIRVFRNNSQYHAAPNTPGEILTLLGVLEVGIPHDTPLTFAFKVSQSTNYPETNKLLEVDYFQHQLA